MIETKEEYYQCISALETLEQGLGTVKWRFKGLSNQRVSLKEGFDILCSFKEAFKEYDALSQVQKDFIELKELSMLRKRLSRSFDRVDEYDFVKKLANNSKRLKKTLGSHKSSLEEQFINTDIEFSSKIADKRTSKKGYVKSPSIRPVRK